MVVHFKYFCVVTLEGHPEIWCCMVKFCYLSRCQLGRSLSINCIYIWLFCEFMDVDK